MIGGIFDKMSTGMNISEALKQGNVLPFSLSDKKAATAGGAVAAKIIYLHIA
ncbi:MAG: hypothetical protein GQ578_01950 [Desulfuromonadaceae bacterium]|nr:hypothetical protein [Desulfuromonadaceae bacterium]